MRGLGLAAPPVGQEQRVGRCGLIGLDPIPHRTETELRGSMDPSCSGLVRGDRCRKSKSRIRPSQAQVVESQERALKEANLFKSPPHQTCRDPDGVGSGPSVDPSSGSSSPSALGPELTLRMADDL
ncbi:hypothetical protein NDU88_004921 [Pleurodeles waltl]|uniref:Uncharacterized protein n=1 Tax=Pleurodeles waltl TaxID=8319 RepID=A0AAV7TVS5_PLEWA|nr:hypothetical protein NDU88_004921 [Pleurodeles waltl]